MQYVTCHEKFNDDIAEIDEMAQHAILGQLMQLAVCNVIPLLDHDIALDTECPFTDEIRESQAYLDRVCLANAFQCQFFAQVRTGGPFYSVQVQPQQKSQRTYNIIYYYHKKKNAIVALAALPS